VSANVAPSEGAGEKNDDGFFSSTRMSNVVGLDAGKLPESDELL